MESQDSVNVTINRPTKVLYFSDGVEEVMEERNVEQQQSEPDSSQAVDPVSLSTDILYLVLFFVL